MRRRRRHQTVPVQHRSLAQILDPQPDFSIVIKRLLDWIDRADISATANIAKPPFQTESGESIFPDFETLWWQTDVQKRQPQPSNRQEMEGDCEVAEDRDDCTDPDDCENDDHAPKDVELSDGSAISANDTEGYDYGDFVQRTPFVPSARHSQALNECVQWKRSRSDI